MSMVSLSVAEAKALKLATQTRPGPLAEEAFHGVAGEFVRTIEPHTEADPAALLLQFLVAFGNAAGRSPHFTAEADRHGTNLNAVFVGETAKGRKGVSWGHIKRFFKDIDPYWLSNIKSGLSSGEGVIFHVRDPVYKENKKGEEILIDEGVEDKRLLIQEAEFSRTLKVMERETSTLSAVLRSSWDTGDLQILTKNSPIRATKAHISVNAHITKEELRRYLNSTEQANGFGNRFLWLCVKRSKVLPFGGKLDINKLNTLTEQLKQVIVFAKNADQITWSEETRFLWAEIYPSLSEGRPGLIGSMLARAEAYTTRLASVYALLNKSTEIKPEHLQAALALWDYCESSVKYIFQDLTGNPLANLIYEALLNTPRGMSRTDIYIYFQKHRTSAEINESLELLESLGRVKKEEEKTEGRTKTVWFFNDTYA